MAIVRLTRKEIDAALTRKYFGKVVIYTGPAGGQVCGKIDRITCEVATAGEPMAIFTINHTRHECDVDYFTHNTEICQSKLPGS